MLGAHQKPVRISLCCAALCKTDICEHKFKAGHPVPDPTRWPLLAGSSEPRAYIPLFPGKLPKVVMFAWMWDRERRWEVGNLLSLQPCPLVIPCGQSPLGAAADGDRSRANVRTQHSPGHGRMKAAPRLQHSSHWEHGDQHFLVPAGRARQAELEPVSCDLSPGWLARAPFHFSGLAR